MKISACPYCGNKTVKMSNMSMNSKGLAAHYEFGCGREVSLEGGFETVIKECPTKDAKMAD